MKHNYLKHLFTALLLLCTTVVTAHDFEVGGVYYKILSEEEKTVGVTFKGLYSGLFPNAYTGCVVIPEDVTYNGSTYSVTSIGGGAFRDCTSLKIVVIPNSVTSIGDAAFYNCKGLKTVINFTNLTFTIGSNSNGYVAYYANKVFYEPNVLIDGDYIWFENEDGMTLAAYWGDATELVLPADFNGKSVTSIGDYAFSECAGLTSIEIPNSVTSIGDYAFSECAGLTSVVMPNSVTSIGDDAFYECTGLTSIEIPSSVTSIGKSAFYYCTGLTSIEIPNSVTSIDNYAFMYCKSLTSIEILGSVTSIGNSAFSSCYALTSIEIPGSVTSIGEDAFSCCDSLKEVYISDLAAWCSIDFGNGVANPLFIAENLYLNGELVTELVIPDGVNEIKNYAFYSFDALTNVVIGNSVTSIGKSAFMNCDGLVSIEIPNSVTSIGNSAFHSCTALTSIEIPNGVTSIGKEAFRDCTGLTSVVIPNSVTSIGNSAFYECHSLTSIEIPGSVTRIGDRVFMQCDGLTSVVIGNGVTSIGYEAFSYCDGLTSVEIPNSVTSIEAYAFSYCSALTRIVIPNSVTSIGGSAFWNCTSLKTVVNLSNLTFSMGTTSHGYIACYANKVFNAPNVFIDGDYIWLENEDGMTLATYWGDATELILPTEFNGKSVTSIGEFAFENCTSLTRIEIPNSVKSIGCGAFNGTAWYENQPEGLVYAGKVLYDYKGAMPSNTSITIKDGTLGISGFAFSSCSGLTSVVIPNSVTNIGRSAFSSCSGLTSVEIPNSVTSIGNYAFDGCSGLTSIEIPNGVTSIGNYAFYGCSSLTSITIPNSVTSIGNRAFSSCSGLTGIEIPNSVTSIGDYAFERCSSLTSIGIPNSVTSIGDYSFCYCKGLTSVVIGNGVTSIGNYAFYYCKGLTSIEIPSSVTSIGYYAFEDCSGLTSITSLIPADKLFIPTSGAFYNVNKNTCTLYVPSGAKETYAATSVWKDFKNIVEIIGGSCGDNVNWMLKDGVLTISGNGAMDDYSVDTMPWYEYKSEIKSVIINSGVTSIGSSAFIGCSGLTSVVIGNSVRSIGEGVFKRCTGLTSIVIPDSVTSIGKGVFYGCSGLTSVVIGNSVTNIGSGAFEGCSGLTSIEIPNSVRSIGEGVFKSCSGLTNVEIPNSVTSIRNEVFRGCSGLTSIVIPSSVTSIGNNAFYGCTALKTVINNSDLDIEEGSTSNGYVAYYADEVIADEFKFELIDGVYTLVKYRGKGIKQKEMTTFDSWTSTNKGQSSSTSSYKYKFDATAGSKLSFDWSVSSEPDYDELYVILDGTTILTKSGVYSGNYEKTFTVAGSHTLEVEYTKDGSVDRNNDEAKIYNVKLARTINKPADVVLPDNYEGELYVIGESAFENNEFVASVTIPEGVEMICYKAFSGCSNLENIVIPNSVLAIGGDAFAGTKWFDNQEDGMVYIGNVLYKYKGSMPDNTAITINDGILGIAGLAFANCTGLTSITSLIPADNLFVPGSDAFVGVDKTNCTLYVPYGAKETYAATEGWEDFENIVEIIPAEITITINQYGCATFCSDLALDFSEVEGLKAYAATGYKSNSQVVTLTRVQTAEAGIGLFLKGEPGEYVVPVIESTDEHSLNMLVGTLEQTVVNSTDGAMSNYKFTIADGDEAPMFYPFEDGTTLSAGKAYLQIPTAWLPATAQKSLSVRFDDGETTDIDELKGENGKVKTIYDLQGRAVENPTSGIYIINGKKVVVK